MKGKFIIVHKDGGYLYKDFKNGWDRTMQLAKAAKFKWEGQAEDVLHNELDPGQCRFWSVRQMESVGVAAAQPACENGRYDWRELSRQQYELFNGLEGYRAQLRVELTEVDLEICDIQHYIEFYNLDAAKGYKAYRMLKERLIRRRRIKDEIAKAGIFATATREDFSSGRVCASIQGFDDRRYTPRVLEELFGLQESA